MINVVFTSKLRSSGEKGGWTVVWPDSVDFFGARGLVKIRGKIDGHPFRSRRKLPVKTDGREAIRKEAGDTR